MRNAGILLLALAAASTAIAQTAELRYHWTTGDVLDYRVTLHTKSDVTVPGRPDASTEQTITQRITLKVGVVAKNAIVVETVTAIRSEVTTPNGTLVVDTAAPSNAANDPVGGPLTKMLQAVVGQPIDIVFAPDGTVGTVQGGSKLLERIRGAANPNAQTAMSSQALTALYSDEAIRTMLEQSFPKLPPRPVKTGDTWKGEIALGNPSVGRINAALTFTVQSLDAERTTIAEAVSLTQNSKPEPSGEAHMTVALGDSHGEGEMVFDVARGRIVRNSMRTEMPSSVEMIGRDGQPRKFQNRVITEATMELMNK
jgi:hypothetical protein